MHEHEWRNDGTVDKGSSMAKIVRTTQDYAADILILSLYSLVLSMLFVWGYTGLYMCKFVARKENGFP